jgi:hypothetical protein
MSDEVTATLEYTLDLHPPATGRRSYSSRTRTSTRTTAVLMRANVADRQRAIERFVAYALARPVVRARPVRDTCLIEQPVAGGCRAT